MSGALYTREILRLAVSIPHQGRLFAPDISADVRSRTCGSRVIADLNLADDGKIKELGLEVNACALGQASTAIVGGQAIGSSVNDFIVARQALTNFLSGLTETPGSWKNIDQLAVAKDHKGRHAAILLPFDAVITAFEQLPQDRDLRQETAE